MIIGRRFAKVGHRITSPEIVAGGRSSELLRLFYDLQRESESRFQTG